MISAARADLDRQALILLCAPTSLGGAAAPAFGPAAWHDFEQLLAERQFAPGQLLGMSEEALRGDLDLTADQANRVSRLLGRGGPVAIEIERLASRGIWMAALGDEDYPPRLVATLGDKAPPLLFGVGRAAVAAQESLAIVGSRDADDDAISYTEVVAASAVKGGLTISSGAARGVDAAAMTSALEHGGCAVGVVADGLEKRIREPQVRAWLADEQLCLLSPYGSNTGFSVGAAMGRNKLIYGLSAFALVVSATPGKGGTWAGATEALKNDWTTLLVRQVSGSQSASERLIALGAKPFSASVPETITVDFLAESAAAPGPGLESAEQTAGDDVAVQVQGTLFGKAEPLVTANTATRKRQRSTKQRAG